MTLAEDAGRRARNQKTQQNRNCKLLDNKVRADSLGKVRVTACTMERFEVEEFRGLKSRDVVPVSLPVTRTSRNGSLRVKHGLPISAKTAPSTIVNLADSHQAVWSSVTAAPPPPLSLSLSASAQS
ncbi:hypothetical protein BaRGS_00040152 [Batillaria attramentaria]|uniref:Uncharacterized protein n=1 Tax=Batillaria attramentaria TaxID=370345 RepID=A0ABD0J0Z8_9CAEN